MAKGFIHTVYKGGQWVNEVEDGEEIGGVHATKEEAVRSGRARAHQDTTEHVIHNQDGSISERNSYGRDPAGRPG
jgi:ketosteroid isomerase-like protein